MNRVIRGCALGITLVVGASCGGQHAENDALGRGDAAWARGDFVEAVAEYRLALRASQDAETVMRVAHAYAQLGRPDDAQPYYRQAVEKDPDLKNQAISDLVVMARTADARGDRYGLASSLEFALELEPGIGIGKLALPLAEYYAEGGEFERALPLFQAAATAMPADEASRIYFDMGQAYEELGQCGRALTFFQQARRGAGRSQRAEISWHVGNCSFELALDLRRSGRDDEALRYVTRVISIGEPRNLLPQAHFEHGEILASRGECTEAVAAFGRAIAESGRGGGPLVPRAEQRIDEIRFGRPAGGDGVRC